MWRVLFDISFDPFRRIGSCHGSFEGNELNELSCLITTMSLGIAASWDLWPLSCCAELPWFKEMINFHLQFNVSNLTFEPFCRWKSLDSEKKRKRVGNLLTALRSWRNCHSEKVSLSGFSGKVAKTGERRNEKKVIYIQLAVCGGFIEEIQFSSAATDHKRSISIKRLHCELQIHSNLFTLQLTEWDSHCGTMFDFHLETVIK